MKFFELFPNVTRIILDFHVIAFTLASRTPGCGDTALSIRSSKYHLVVAACTLLYDDETFFIELQMHRIFLFSKPILIKLALHLLTSKRRFLRQIQWQKQDWRWPLKNKLLCTNRLPLMRGRVGGCTCLGHQQTQCMRHDRQCICRQCRWRSSRQWQSIQCT